MVETGSTDSLEPFQIVLGLTLALAVGAMVGLERERHAFVERKRGIGGARTFPLVALYGALIALLGRGLGVVVFAAGIVALAGLLALGLRRESGAGEERRHGLTTELSALLVCLIACLPFVEIGPLSFPQRLLLAGALGTVVMSLLALRQPIHEFAATLSQEDMLATVRFALVTVVALPLLPDRAYGPFDALNPFRIGIVIVLIAGIGFVGYVAVRWLGARRGIGVTALAGGLVSSTAVTLTFAAKGRERSDLARACSLAIVLAATVMFARMLVEIAVIDATLTAPAAAPLGAMLATGALACALVWRRLGKAADGEETKGLQNPFRLRQALRLGLVYAAVRLLAVAAWNHYGSGGLLVSAALAGFVDVDAITISTARMHADGLDPAVAVAAITVAAASNTLVKASLAVALGGREVGRAVVAALVPVVVVGGLVSWLAA